MSKGPGNRGSKRARKVKARTRRRGMTPVSRGSTAEIGSVVDAFADWISGEDLGQVDTQAVVSLLRSMLGDAAFSDPTFSATAWTPAQAHAFLDRVGAMIDTSADDDDLDDMLELSDNMISAMVLYFMFLDETDRWTGSDEDYDHCMDDFRTHLEDFDDEPEPLDVDRPDIPADRELAALVRLPVIAHLRGLLTWVGEGRPVTEDGVPQTAQMGSIVDATGIALLPTTETETDLSVDVGFMAPWRAAVVAELIEVAPTQVRPGTNAGRLVRPSVDDLDVIREAVSVSIAIQCIEPLAETGEVAELLESITRKTVLAAMSEEPHAVDPGEQVSDERRRVLDRVNASLSRCVAAGWLTDDAVHSVPMDLRPAVYDALMLLADQRSSPPPP